MYTESEKKSKKWLLFIPLIIALIILVILLIPEKNANKPKSNDFEKRIIDDAKEYVSVNNIHENTFITLADIESSIGTLYDTCNKSSGVDYRNGKYEPYVICTRYISPKIERINNQSYDTIILKEDSFSITSSSKYVEPGFVSDYKVDVRSFNNFSKQGIYQTDYYVKNSSGKVIEVATRYILYTPYNNDLNNAKMILKGDREIYIKKGTKFVDPFVDIIGATDPDAVSKVKVTGKVNTNVPGTYTLTYTLNQLSESRKVIVTSMEYNVYLSTSNYTKSPVKIIVDISSNEFSRLILPNGNGVSKSKYEYEVEKNGTYKFIIVTTRNERIEVTKEVTNIDKVKPVVSCTGKAENKKTTINITAADDSGIKYYKYGDYAKEVKSNTYVIDKMLRDLWVTVTDNAMNETDALCKIDYVEPTKPDSKPESPVQPTDPSPSGDYKMIRLTHFEDGELAKCGQSCVRDKMSKGEIITDEHGWYMYKYNGKWYYVVATAIDDANLIAKYGHESYTDIKYYHYYDTFKIYISDTTSSSNVDSKYKGYDVIILDVCGACMKFSTKVQDIHPNWSTSTIDKWRKDAVKGNSIKIDLWIADNAVSPADWAFIEF